jgi:hypothetical protein
VVLKKKQDKGARQVSSFSSKKKYVVDSTTAINCEFHGKERKGRRTDLKFNKRKWKFENAKISRASSELSYSSVEIFRKYSFEQDVKVTKMK